MYIYRDGGKNAYVHGMSDLPKELKFWIGNASSAGKSAPSENGGVLNCRI